MAGCQQANIADKSPLGCVLDPHKVPYIYGLVLTLD